MGATGFVAYTAVRRRWARVVALSVLVAVVGGVVTAAVLGAERSRTSLERFIADTNAADAGVFVQDQDELDALVDVPGVAMMSRFSLLAFVPSLVVERDDVFLPMLGSHDGRFPYEMPGDIISYDGIGGVPHLLAAVLVALGLAVLVHLLVGSVRLRRRELAVLRTLGLRPRQVAATLLWQTSAQIIAVLVIAAPVGVIAGRISWRWFADRIGIASDPSIPLVVVALSSVAVLAIANLVALPFARRAGSIHPARALRAE